MNATNPMERTVGLLKDVTGYAATLLAFFLAIFGKLPVGYPATTGALTCLVFSVALWMLRWPKITLQKPVPTARELLIIGERKTAPISFWRLLIDPFLSTSTRAYTLTIQRRRLEGVLLVGLTLGSTGLAGMRFTNILAEWGYAQCETSPGKYILAVADFLQTSTEKTNSKQQLIEELENYAPDQIQICDFKQTVQSQNDAQTQGRRVRASLVLWGRSDPNLFEVHLEAISMHGFNQDVRVMPADISMFEMNGRAHVVFLAKMVLSALLYYQEQKSDEAIQLLTAALDEAQYASNQEEWTPAEKKDLGNGYRLLGDILSDGRIAPGDNHLDKPGAIDALGKAYAFNPKLDGALFQRGSLYQDQGEKAKAAADYTTLIEKNSYLAAEAYAKLASLGTCAEADEDLSHAIALKPDKFYAVRGKERLICDNRTGAIEDLREAVRRSPKDPNGYMLLGRAYLLDNQVDQARQTYQAALPYLDSDTKQNILDDLQSLSKDQPALAPATAEIIKFINKAKIP